MQQRLYFRRAGRPGAHRLGILAVLIAATGLWLVGCGGSSTPAADSSTPAAKSTLEGLSADEVLARAVTASSAAKSVHVKGGGTSDGQKIEIDLKFANGEGATGTFSIAGGVVTLVSKGTDIWFKGDEAFYKAFLGTDAPAGTAQLVAGKFIKASTTDPQIGPLANFADMKAFLTGTLKPDGTISRVDGTPVNGVATVGLKSSSDSGGTLLIADDGTDLPLQLLPGSGGSTGSLTFSEWGTAVELTPPPADEVVDLKALTGQ